MADLVPELNPAQQRVRERAWQRVKTIFYPLPRSLSRSLLLGRVSSGTKCAIKKKRSKIRKKPRSCVLVSP